MKSEIKNLVTPLQKGILILLIFCGCSTVKVRHEEDYPSMLAKKDKEIVGLREQVKLLEYLGEGEDGYRGRYEALRKKVDRFLRLRHGCKHVGMLR